MTWAKRRRARRKRRAQPENRPAGPRQRRGRPAATRRPQKMKSDPPTPPTRWRSRRGQGEGVLLAGRSVTPTSSAVSAPPMLPRNVPPGEIWYSNVMKSTTEAVVSEMMALEFPHDYRPCGPARGFPAICPGIVGRLATPLTAAGRDTFNKSHRMVRFRTRSGETVWPGSGFCFSNVNKAGRALAVSGGIGRCAGGIRLPSRRVPQRRKPAPPGNPTVEGYKPQRHRERSCFGSGPGLC